MRLDKFPFNAWQWWRDTPDRALEQAHKAALAIQNIEAEYFGGNKIAVNAAQNTSVTAYFLAKRNKLLRTMRWRLSEFRVASEIIPDRNPPDPPSFASPLSESGSGSTLAIAPSYSRDSPDYHAQQILNKLELIDQVLERYRDPDSQFVDVDIPKPQPEVKVKDEKETISSAATKNESIFSKSGFLPRSLLNTGRRLRRELRSDSESEVVKAYQLSKFRTRKSFQFLAILLIVPLLTQQVSKNFVFAPIIGHFQRSRHIEISLNSQQEREAIEEIELFEKKIKFEQKIGKIPTLSAEDFEKLVTEKTMAIATARQYESLNAVENVFADITSVSVFVWILLVSQENIRILKSFMDELIYGLSDSAKAFVIILFTDVFVGFHSTHGWEIFLEAIANHFGIPENRNFIFLFIATFPVALDSIFKYWIFRYLSQISPSAVATYKNMNE